VDRVTGERSAGVEGVGARDHARWPFARWGSWFLLATYLVLAIAALALGAQGRGLDPDDLAEAADSLIWVSVGAFIAVRRPANPIGWLLCLIGIAAVFSRLVAEYVAAATAGAAVPFAAIAAWLDVWVWTLSLGPGLILLPLLFPDGHLPTPRWRPVAWLAVAALVVPTAGLAFTPGPFASLPSVVNPFGVAPLAGFPEVGEALLVLAVAVAAITCASAPVVRYRHAPLEERQQLRWFACASGLLVVTLFLNIAFGGATLVLLEISLALVPIAIGVAILRYRLYEIDVIINRTLVWVPLTGILGGLYAGLVALIQRVFVNVTGDKSDAAIIITTLIVAGSITPIRRVLDTIVDRRFRSPTAPHPTGAPALAGALSLDDPEVVRRIEAIAERVARQVGQRDG
jgi:hypothetical protein